MSAPPPARKPGKPHVSLQSCDTCAYSRTRPGTRRDMECRWDGPPWTERGVAPGDWCRRWAPIPPPPKPALAKGA